MTLIYELVLDILKCTCTPKMRSRLSEVQKFESEQNRHTDKRDRTHYLPQTFYGRPN